MTAKISNLSILKKTIKAIALIAFFYLTTKLSCSGQTFELVDSVSIPTPARASIDRLNNIYIVDENGNINKYGKEGNIDLQYSPQQLAEISLIEAWNPLKIFIFYQDFQEFVFLDRFLTASSRFSTRDYGNYIGMATISMDNNIWCIDYSDFSLKKYDITLNQLILNTPLSLILNQDHYEIRFMREYQNLLFVSDYSSGIFIFDNLGNFLRKIDIKEVDYFSFIGDEVYFCSGNQIIITNIYGEEKRTIEMDEEVKFAFFYDDEVTILTDSKLKWFKIVPKK